MDALKWLALAVIAWFVIRWFSANGITATTSLYSQPTQTYAPAGAFAGMFGPSSFYGGAYGYSGAYNANTHSLFFSYAG